MPKDLVYHYKLFPDVCLVRYYEKFQAELFFSLEILPFFQKFVFSTTSWLLKKGSYTFHSICQNTLCTPINCPRRFVALDGARKKRPKSFIHWKVCLFFQKFVFSTTSWLLKKWPYILHKKFKNTLWSLTEVYSMSALVGKMGKKWAKIFFFRTIAFNLKTLDLDFLGKKEMII